MKSLKLFLLLSFLMATACSGHRIGEGGSSVLAQGAGCLGSLKSSFSSTYYPFLRANCASCHYTGGAGNGAFADPNRTIAFEQFSMRSTALINGKAIDPNHQPPFTGTRHQSAISGLDTRWQGAMATYQACKVASGEEPEPTPPAPQTANFVTVPKVMNATNNNRTITWNFANELQQGTPIAGLQLQLNVRIFTSPTGLKSYQFSNPRLRISGAQAYRVMRMDVMVNGRLEASSTTYRSVDRRVPGNNQTRQLSAATLVLEMNTNAADTVSVGIGELQPIDFAPPTFAQLVDPATGVFGMHCVSCHGPVDPPGGFDISNRGTLIGLFYVVPFNPMLSVLHTRVTNAASPMPPTGLISAQEQKQILDWILDGAP